MDDAVDLLRQHTALVVVWRLVVWSCVGYLLILAAVVFLRPTAARRFLDGYASSPRINFLEAVLRLIAGLGFMGASPEMKLSVVFFWFGAVLVATAIPMMFLYGVHRRFASWAIAFASRGR